MTTLFPESVSPVVRKDAGLSPCGSYRYWLTRQWDDALPTICWCMLNPSTADATVDDQTIKKCMSFSRAWGNGGIVVVNLFALRATDPRALAKATCDPVSDQAEPHPWRDNLNDAWIIAKSDGCRLIAGWGNHGALNNRNRQVMNLLDSRRVECLGVTGAGHPRHPLYVRGDVLPVPYRLEDSK